MKSCQKKLIVYLLGFLLIFMQVSVSAYAEEDGTTLELYAQSAVLMDADSGRVLFEKNGYSQMPMASTTKIMTCILALEKGNLSDYAEVSAYASGMPKVKLYMRQGEYYKLEDLLYSLMLESHNDSAVAIAELIGGSVEGFANMMNEKAREIGCENTCFITPNGLDASTVDGSRVHSTTASDLARIMSYCITQSPQKEAFLQITRTASYSFSSYKASENGAFVPGGRNFNVNNKNRFLTMMDGALSGKTGFTGNAGYCYVGALERDGRTFVVALLACGWPNNKNYKWSDTVKLMNYGLENYQYRDVYREIPLEALLVEGGIPSDAKPYGNAYAEIKMDTQDQELMALLGPKEEVEARVTIPDVLSAPLNQGESIGTVTYMLNGEVIKEYSVVVENEVEKLTFSYIAGYIFRTFIL